MIKIRHLAFASRNPGKSAEFYKKAFGWREIRRGGPDPNNPTGVVLSDGSVNISILTFSNNQIGKGTNYEGFHHMGVVVDDVQDWAERLGDMGVQIGRAHV